MHRLRCAHTLHKLHSSVCCSCRVALYGHDDQFQCAVYRLQGSYNGGGMYYVSVYTGEPMSTLNVTNSIFKSNSADLGGGVNTEDVAATITNCTFIGNKVSGCRT
jgi:hypothetical protein